jgi:hypothetical protein
MQEGYSKNSVVSNIGDDVEIQKLITESVEFYIIDTKTAVFSPIISTYETKVDTLIKFRTDLSKEFISAEDSLFYVENKSSFVRAADLELGDKLVCPTGDSIEYILSIHPCAPVDDAESTVVAIQHMNGDTMGYFINGVLVKNNSLI